jgi:NADH-quinone oxidoreductase subunit J
MVVASWHFAPEAMALRLNPNPEGVTNTEALGRILYTDHIYLFQGAGLVLLVAMIGAIVLTLRERPGTRRQNISEQIARSGSVALRSVPVEDGAKQVEHHQGHGGHH